MINTNSILSGINNLQQDAQANNPVIPNNGNPGGANNMAPQGQQPIAPARATQPYYPWLGPSQHMQDINNLIGKMGVQTQAQPPASVPAQIQQANVPAPMPVLPQYREGAIMGQQPVSATPYPVLPQMNV